VTEAFVSTARQRQAIEAPPGPVLVLAGPGAGKTFCLIERIRFLIEQRGFDPARIVAVTFTNKAAGEIAHRLRGALGERADLITRSTIHALCVKVLREHGELVGVRRGFGIADEDYQRLVLRRAGFFKDVGWPLNHFSRHRVQDVPMGDWLARLYERYREILDARGLLDFDDLVLKTEHLLRTDETLTRRISAQWDYVLVDEAQDLNPKQYAVLRHLAAEHRNLFVVGDDEQSIFAWAGADLRVLQQLANDFGIRSQIVLDENRRCSRAIFETARRLVALNPVLFEKTLTATRESPWPVLVRNFDDDQLERRWLVEDLAQDRATNGHPWGEIAILYRKHEVGNALESALLEAGIPCQLAQGRALADDPVVLYLLAALKVIAAPDDPVRAEEFARVVLPRVLYADLRARADQASAEFMQVLSAEARRRPRKDEDGRKLRRLLSALDNLVSLPDRHPTLSGLVLELLSQRVGEYRTLLEEHAETLTDPDDPLTWPGLPALADDLARARHGRGRVWLPRLGGAELGLATMLYEAGVTMVGYLDPGAPKPHPADLTIPASPGLPLRLFKALQLLRSRDLPSGLTEFVALDVETTDNDVETCEVVELGAVRVRSGQVVDRFHSLVRPGRPISPRASEIHGYTDGDVATAPPFTDVWARFRAFAGPDLLLAHNGHRFDFLVLERLSRGHPAGNDFARFDSLPLARDLHAGSARLEDLAHAFGVEAGRAHHALDDALTLAHVFLALDKRRIERARKVSEIGLLEHLAVSLALTEPAEWSSEARDLFELGKLFALGRYGRVLGLYDGERSRPGGEGAPDVEALIKKLGGRALMERLRRQKSAEDRYPAAMARLRRLLDLVGSASLGEQLREFLDRVALSTSRAGPEVEPDRVNLLTLHSTKGLEFSRVYIVGVEDAELPGTQQNREPAQAELEEARRLLYVGMTRAKDRLVLTRADRRNDLPTGGRRFLEEMELVEAVNREP
jgi:DNA polymerase III epsilon subunit family exonuclease